MASKKSVFKFSISLLFFILVGVPSSWAGLDLVVLGGPSFTNQIISSPGGSTTSNETYFSLGVWKNLVFPDSPLSLSSGLLYTQTGAKTQSTILGFQATYDAKTPYLQIPVLLGFWPTEWTAMGIGAYAGIPLGQTSLSGTTSAGGAFTATATPGFDYGLVLDGQIKIPVGVLTCLFLNGLYEYGLANIDTSGNTVKNFSFLLLGGVGLGF